MPSIDTKMHLVVAPKRQILTDTRHNLWAIALLIAILLGYVLASAVVIKTFERESQHWSYSESIYFTVINVTTVGFGDYYPKTPAGRALACVNALIGLIFFGLLVAVVALAFQPGELSATATFGVPTAGTPREAAAGDDSVENGLRIILRSIEQRLALKQAMSVAFT